MRTIQQQQMEIAMLAEIAEILKRSRPVLVEDALGVISLFVLLFAGLGFSGTL